MDWFSPAALTKQLSYGELSHCSDFALAALLEAPTRNDFVAAGSFSLIQRSVGQLQKFLGMSDVSLPRRYAEADRYKYRIATEFHWMSFDHASQALCGFIPCV